MNKPARGEASLDLILTNTSAHLANVDRDYGLGNSDHNFVCFDFNVFISLPHQAPKIVYEYKNAFFTNAYGGKLNRLSFNLNGKNISSAEKKVKSEINKWYWHHYRSLQNSNNPKRFWTFVKSKTKSRFIPPEVSLENQKASNSFDKAQLVQRREFLSLVQLFKFIKGHFCKH